MRSEREPVCKYYDGGACLFMRDFPQEKTPLYASNMTLYLTPAVAKAFRTQLNYREPVYYCRAADIVTKFPGAAQKAGCDRYIPNQNSTISSK